MVNPLITSKQASKKERVFPLNLYGIAHNIIRRIHENEAMIRPCFHWIFTSFLVFFPDRTSKEPMLKDMERLKRKSTAAGHSLKHIEVMTGMNIKDDIHRTIKPT